MDLKLLQNKMDKADGKSKDKPYYQEIHEYEKVKDIPERTETQKFVDYVFNIGKKKSKQRSVFDDPYDIKYKLKRKKEKKRKKSKYTNYEAIFLTELNRLRQLRDDQHNFTQELQKKFDQTVGKSSYRGINKYETDLTMAIIASRNLEAQIDERIARTKETIYKMKSSEKKDIKTFEYRKVKDKSQDDEQFASSLMMNLMSNRQNIQSKQESIVHQSTNIEQLLNDRINDDNPYIRHEADGIKHVVETHSDGSYQFVAYNKRSGEKIDNYPTPPESNLRFVEDQMLVKDDFGNQYEWHKK